MYDQSILLAVPVIFLCLALLTLTLLLVSAKFNTPVLTKLFKSLCTVRGAALSAVSLSLVAGIAWSFYADACKPNINELLNVNACGGHKIQLKTGKIRINPNTEVN